MHMKKTDEVLEIAFLIFSILFLILLWSYVKDPEGITLAGKAAKMLKLMLK